MSFLHKQYEMSLPTDSECSREFNQKAWMRWLSIWIRPAFVMIHHLVSLHVQLRFFFFFFLYFHIMFETKSLPPMRCFNGVSRIPGMVPGQPQRASLAPPLEQKEQQWNLPLWRLLTLRINGEPCRPRPERDIYFLSQTATEQPCKTSVYSLMQLKHWVLASR